MVKNSPDEQPISAGDLLDVPTPYNAERTAGHTVEHVTSVRVLTVAFTDSGQMIDTTTGAVYRPTGQHARPSKAAAPTPTLRNRRTTGTLVSVDRAAEMLGDRAAGARHGTARSEAAFHEAATVVATAVDGVTADMLIERVTCAIMDSLDVPAIRKRAANEGELAQMAANAVIADWMTGDSYDYLYVDDPNGLFAVSDEPPY